MNLIRVMPAEGGLIMGTTTTYILVGTALVAFAIIGITASRRGLGQDAYLTARNSQGRLPLALSFFASALGAWILLAPPEIGSVHLGIAAVAGYAVGQAGAIWIYAVIGPRIRRVSPDGRTILGFVGARFGKPFQIYVAGISVLYMSVFLIAEFSGIGKIVGLLSDADPRVVIVLVAAVTALYTAWGGLPASLRTDRWQAGLIAGLVVVGTVAVLRGVEAPISRAIDGGLLEVSRPGMETFVILVIAVIAANLFHQGFWQRVWAAGSDDSLRAGASWGALLILPLMLLMGFFGMVAAGPGFPADPSVAFFDLMQGLSTPILAVVALLAVALTASTVDTLQTSLASIVAGHLSASTSLTAARLVTTGITLAAVVIAWRDPSVLRVFLVADLLAATIAIPVMMGLTKRVSGRASIAGAIAGLVAVVGVAVFRSNGAAVGDILLSLTMPSGPSIGFFVAAPLASAAVTLGLTNWSKTTSVTTTSEAP
jgi:Na+/proline symporter